MVRCAVEARAAIGRERDAFEALYPQASIQVRDGSSRDAVGDLFRADCDLAVLTRELEPEERAAAARGRLGLVGYRFARDGLVILVHPENPLQNLTLEEVRGIWAGTVKNWSELGGEDRAIEPIAPAAETDEMEFFVQKVMEGEPIRARTVPAGSDSELVHEVSSRRGGIGFAPLAWVDRGARALRLSNLRGLAYTRPDPETIYRGEYPLTRFYNLYARDSARPLANGLVTYVTSYDGQKLVQESGLVPTAVPVRFVRRSPLLGTH